MRHPLLGRTAASLFLVAVQATFAAHAAMNLRVDSVGISGNPANAGGTTVFSATVTNTGDQVTAAIVQVYLSSDAQLTAEDDQIIGFAQSPVLNPGQSATVTQTVNLPARLATGDYFLGTITRGWFDDVDPSDNVGVVSLSVVGATCSPDAFEQDDTRASALAIAVNQSQVRNLCDDPDDWISFQAVAGTRYGIQAAGIGFNADSLTLALYSADGTLLGTTPFGPGTKNPKLVWTAPTSDVFYVRTRPTGQWFDVGIGTEYSLVVADALAELLMPFAETQQQRGTSGGTLYFYTNVSNHGFTDSGAFDVGVHISTSPVVTRNDARIGHRTVANLPADGTMDIAPVLLGFPSGLPAGTYYLAAVADDTDAVAEYEEGNNVSQSTSIVISGPTCTPDAYEDDDFFEMAKPIGINEQQRHNFCEDAFDWLRFDAVAGRTYFLRSQYPPANPGAPVQVTGLITVYDSGARQLAQGNGVLAWTAPQSGTFYVLVGGAGSGNGTMVSSPDYFFGVLDGLPDLSVAPAFSIETSLIPRGGVIEDVSFTARNDGFVDSPASMTGFYFSTDASIALTDQLLATQPLAVVPPGGEVQKTFVRVPVPAAQPLGTYYLGPLADIGNAVPEFDENNNGSALTQVQVTNPACAPDAFDDDDVPGQAKPLAPGAAQNRNFCEDGWDWASVDMQAGTTYAFEAKSNFGNPTRVLVYDTAGANVLVDGDNGSGSDATYGWAAFTAPAAGRYYVLATTLDPVSNRTRWGTNRDYALRVATCQPDAFEPDDADRTAGKPIAVGSSQARNHCDDGVDWAVLTIATPGSYTVATSALGVAADTALEIHNATSTAPLASNDNASVNNKASSVTYNFATAGTYYIRIAGKQRGAGTEYTLSVQPAKGKK
jgi:hypothetical protein